MEEKGGLIDRWVKKQLGLYTEATRHPFVLRIRDGSIDHASFKRWLVQDYKFVREFVPFAASVFIKASKTSDDKNDMEVILGGLASCKDEIEWFKQEALKWDVSLSNIVVLKANDNYCRFLESLMLPEVEYAVAITAFWAIDAVYQDAFSYCVEEGNNAPLELQQVCSRWGNEAFGEYCSSLKKIANRVLEKSSDEVCAKAEAALLHVLEHEIEFWNMGSGGL